MRAAPPRPEVSTAKSSFVSDTSSTGTSSTASGSTFTLPSSAPTPYNTYISPASEDVFGSSSRPSLTSSGEAGYIREPPIPGKDNGGTSIQPGRSVSFLSDSSRPTPTSSRHPSSLSSRAGSSHHLLPYSPPIRDPQTQSFMVPVSERPIPLPPIQLADTGVSPPPTPDAKAYTSSSLYRQPSSVISTPSAATSHKASFASRLLRRRGHAPSDKKTQEDRDALRLQQLGYDAVLGRDYTFWSSLAISWLNIGCIQGTVYAVSGAYSFGGPLMILIMWPLSGLWTIFLTLALAELASVYPVSGAMASWAWKVARGGVGYERWWAWLMGGVVLGGHVASVLLVTWQLVNIIHGVMGLAFDYTYQPWHGILFFLTVLLVCGLLGSQSWGRSHKFWMGAGMYGVSVWLILCVSLISAGARHSHSVSADLFLNKTGWESKPYVFLLGWSYCTIASGHDASAHMAEETQNPSRNVPNAMVAAMALTYICGMISISLLLLSIDPQDARTVSEHTFAVGYILTQAINRQGAIAICCLLIFTLTVQIMAQLQASSRFVFAMARDNAMPFASSIRRTNASKQPIVAHWLVIALCVPFSILVLAGKGPVYSVLAVTASTLSYMGYTTPVLLYLLSGKDLRTEGRSSWSLRRKSKIIGAIGVTYGIAVIAISTAPGSYPVTIENISWSPVILVGTVLVCFVTWRYYGIKHYSGPIKAVTKWETGVEIDLQSTLTTQRSKPSGPPLPTFSHTEGYEEEGQEDLIKDVLPDGGGVVLVESATTGGTGISTEWTDATATTEGMGSTFTRDSVSRMGGVGLSSTDLGERSARSG